MAKTIEVSDEMYDFLIELSKEINTQNNRMTRMPYIFQVQEKKEIYVPYGCGHEVWIHNHNELLLRNDDDIKDKIFDINEWNINDTEMQKKYDDIHECEIEGILIDNGFSKMHIDEECVYSNAFFTEKACKEHIESNRYNYRKPKDYLSAAYRNYEMEKIFEFLCGLTGGEMIR